MMELGATVCRPRRAALRRVPGARGCAARRRRGRAARARRRRAGERFEDTDRWARGRVVAALLAGERAARARAGAPRARARRARARRADRARRGRLAAAAVAGLSPPRPRAPPSPPAATRGARRPCGPRRRSAAWSAGSCTRVVPSSTCSAPMSRSPRCDRLAQRQLERLLGLGGERDECPAPARARRPRSSAPAAEGRLDAAADLVEVDADRGQRLAVDGRARRAERSASCVERRARRARCAATPVGARGGAEQQVLRADALVPAACGASACAATTT